MSTCYVIGGSNKNPAPVVGWCGNNEGVDVKEFMESHGLITPVDAKRRISIAIADALVSLVEEARTPSALIKDSSEEKFPTRVYIRSMEAHKVGRYHCVASIHAALYE